MSVYEELAGNVCITDADEFAATLAEFKRRFTTKASGSGNAVFACDDYDVYVRFDLDAACVRVMVDENNHAVDRAADESKLFEWVTMTLAALRTSSGALHYKSEMCDYSTEWVRYGR